MKRNFEIKERYSMDDLLRIVALLRDPQDGCAWDKVQTHKSIRKNFLEETYEVADAIDLNDAHLLCEELGDVLLQVALHTQMEKEKGRFSFEDVCTGICKKLIARHPHIFGDAKAENPEQALQNWEALKRQEKHRESLTEDLASVPQAMPSLMRAAKLSKRAAAHGIRRTAEQTAESLEENVRLFCSAATETSSEHTAELLGNLLFDAVDLGRQMHCDAEEALDQTNRAFVERMGKTAVESV